MYNNNAALVNATHRQEVISLTFESTFVFLYSLLRKLKELWEPASLLYSFIIDGLYTGYLHHLCCLIFCAFFLHVEELTNVDGRGGVMLVCAR